MAGVGRCRGCEAGEEVSEGGTIRIKTPFANGPGERHRQLGDPAKLKRDNTKSHHARKSKHDAGLTPTEQRRKDVLMRQFMKTHEGERNSEAYRNSPIWCAHPGCTRMNGSHSH